MSEDQLQPEDTLEDRGVEDVLDEGFSPPDREPYHLRHPDDGESSLDERLAEEEPEVWEQDRAGDPDADPDVVAGEVGDVRAGRLLAPDEGAGEDVDSEMIAQDEGIDGAGASAEEAAMHIIEE